MTEFELRSKLVELFDLGRDVGEYRQSANYPQSSEPVERAKSAEFDRKTQLIDEIAREFIRVS